MERSVYICGPLTELPDEQQADIKQFYSELADLVQKITGTRAHVPHEHGDPLAHSQYTPRQIDELDRTQVCRHTSFLLVIALAPSWGGGIEVEMANQNNIPVIILCEEEKLEQRKISRLLRGNPAVKAVIPYKNKHEAMDKLQKELKND